MKWDLRDFDRSPELNSDIEWMLQSGQVSRIFFLETLTSAYFAPISHLALSLLNDVTAARAAVYRTFLKAALNLHRYRSQYGVEYWLYKIAWEECKRKQQGERLWKRLEALLSSAGDFTDPVQTLPPSEHDQEIWDAIDKLEGNWWSTLILKFANGWSSEQITKIIGIGGDTVDRYLSQALREVARQTSQSPADLESDLKRSLDVRWPPPQPSAVEIEQFAHLVDKRAGAGHSMRHGFATLKELAIIGLAILLVFLAIWGGNRYLLRTEGDTDSRGSGSSNQPGAAELAEGDGGSESVYSSTPQPGSTRGANDLYPGPTPTPTPTGIFYYVQEGDSLESLAATLGSSIEALRQLNRIPAGETLRTGQALLIPRNLPESLHIRATPVIPVVHDLPLRQPITSRDVFDLLNPDVYPFSTIWFDAQVLTYATGDETISPVVNRIQVWLSQRQMLLIGGPAGEEPTEVGIGLWGNLYVSKPGIGERFFKETIEPSLSGFTLYGAMMLFGESDELAYSTYEVIGESEVAGRAVWVVSRFMEDRIRQSLLWLDKKTGMVLRIRRNNEPEMDANTGEYRPSEVIVQSIAYDVNFPQDLFDIALPWRGGFARDSSGEPAASGEQTPTIREGQLALREKRTSPPEGFDPSSSRLSFRYPIGSYQLPSMAGTDILADGYYLMRLRMGVPWNAICERSPDGAKLVFVNHSSDRGGTGTLSRGPYYFDLHTPGEIYRLFPTADRVGDDFAISPDSRQVAFWACEREQGACGIYLHDMTTHTRELLLEIQDGADALTWSPTGDQLVFLTGGNTFMVVDVISRDVLFTGEYDSQNMAATSQFPTESWGSTFPSYSGGLEACVDSPLE